MRIEQLNHILEIVKWRSMSQAAKHLYINPSTLSISISNLEDELGFKIFNRTTQGVSLTVLGQEVVTFAENTLLAFEKLKQLPSDRERLCGFIDLFASPAVCNTIAINIMTAFKKIFPFVNIHVHEKSPTQIMQQLKSGEALIGVANFLESKKSSLLEEVQKHNLMITELGRDQLKLYVSVHSPLAKESSVTIEQIKDYPFASYSEYFTASAVTELVQFKNIYGFSDRESIKKVVAENQAIAIYPSLMEYDDPYVTNQIIVPIEVSDLNYALSYYLIYSKNICLSLVEQALLDVIINQYGEIWEKLTKTN